MGRWLFSHSFSTHQLRIDTSVMDDATVLRHVQHLSEVEANLSDIQREMLHSDTAFQVATGLRFSGFEVD